MARQMTKRQRLVRRGILVQRIKEQRDWIRACKVSGVSYADRSPSLVMPGLTRGQAIRRADEQELVRLLREQADLEGGA